jgi:hypothetical protein
MAKRTTYNVITGNDPRLGMSFYYSPYFGQNIWRRMSSLTGERTKKDPAFTGFRQSICRLKQASPIAASLYKLLPVQAKKYTLYRTLTGEAIKMLKDGLEAGIIKETLRKKYINPLMDAPGKDSLNKTVEKPVSKESRKGMADFISYPQLHAGVRKMPRTRRTFLLQKIKEGQPAVRYLPTCDSVPLPQASRKVSASQCNEPERSNESIPRTKTTSGLIYLGRLPECKKLKIWVRPVDSSSLSPVVSCPEIVCHQKLSGQHKRSLEFQIANKKIIQISGRFAFLLFCIQMARSQKIFPVSKRPLEYVAFFCIKIPTKEGDAHLFTAFDPFMDFIFSLSVEREESPETVLKNVYFLMENPQFVPYMAKGFTLVFEKYEDLSERISKILEPAGGKWLFDKPFNHYLSDPVVQSLVDYLKNNKNL